MGEMADQNVEQLISSCTHLARDRLNVELGAGVSAGGLECRTLHWLNVELGTGVTAVHRPRRWRWATS